MLLGGTAARRPPRLARDRRRRPRLRDRTAPLYDAVVVGAGLACLLRALERRARARRLDRDRRRDPRLGRRRVYWTAFIDGDPSPPYPSPADVGYLAFYPLADAGLGLLVRARAARARLAALDGRRDRRARHRRARRRLRLRLRRRPDHRHRRCRSRPPSPTRSATSLMLSLVVGVVALTRWRPGRTWSLLLAGLAALVVADVAYTLQIDRRGPAGRRLDRPDLPDRRRLPRRRGLAAAAAARSAGRPLRRLARADGPGGLRRGDDRPLRDAVLRAPASGLATVLWAATMLAVIVRLAISVRENKRAAGAGADRPADRARQPRRHAGRPRRPLRAATERGAGDAAAPRPQRLQALQRHLRPPRRRRAAEPARRRAARRGRRATAPPTGSAATSSRPAHRRRATASSAVSRARGRGADRERAGLRASAPPGAR